MADKKLMKRQAAQSINNLFRAVENISTLKEIFEEHHPDYAKVFTMAIKGIGFLVKELTTVYTHAWGYFPDDLSKWMH